MPRPSRLALALIVLLLAGCPPDEDLDGDGHVAPADCDDGDPAVHPDASEVCDNGLDDNCDGAAPECRQTGTVTLATGELGVLGASASSLLGSSLANVGDLDGDGFQDVLAGAPGDDTAAEDAGAAWLLFGSGAGFDPDRSLLLSGAASGDRAGVAVGGGLDLTGDGIADLLVGAPAVAPRDAAFIDDGTGLAAGAIYIVPGPFGTGPDDGGVGHGARSLGADENLVVSGVSETDCLGRAFDAADADGDGVGDLLAPAVCAGSRHIVHPHGNLDMLVDGPGQVAVLDGPFTGDVSRAAGRATWSGDEDWDRFGSTVAWARDYDGDGVRDVAIGAPDYFGAEWINLAARGRVLLFSGSGQGALGTDEALAAASGGCCGSERHEAVGSALVSADLDGDGVADLLAGAPRLDDFGVQGGAFALSGDLSGDLDALTDGTWVAGPPQEAQLPTRAGAALAAGFDLDCDGALDLALGAPDDATAGARGGGVRVHYGAVQGFVTLGDDPERSLHIVSTLDNEQLGAAVIAADVNGDGCGDLVLGAPEARESAPQAGAVRLLLGTGM